MDTSSIGVGLFSLLIGCAIALAAWICMLIYRGALEAREDDQIFLDKAEDAMAQQQRQLVARIERINPIINTLLVIWIVLALISAGLWIWQGLKSF